MEMRLFVYPIIWDTDFAPHVGSQDNYLTLATCKPKIRKQARKGDWVMAVTGKTAKNVKPGKVAYIFEVTEEPITQDEYWRDHRFKGRVDNIYYLENGKYRQKKGTRVHQSAKDQQKDTSGKVLVSTNFCRFGHEGPNLADIGFPEFIPDWRDYKCGFKPATHVAKLIEHFRSERQKHKNGLIGNPIHAHRRKCS